MNKLSDNLQALNGIRGFAILLVLLSHASNRKINLAPWLDFGGAGRYGVFLFFVLSAFLLTRQFLVSSVNTSETSNYLGQYFKRRFLRIYPLYTIALVTYFVLIKLGHPYVLGIGERGYMNGSDLVSSLFLMDAKGFFWTIPVEFQYYFILPVVAFMLMRGIGHTTLTLFLSVLLIFIWSRFSPPRYVPNVLPFLPIFLCGSLTAFCYVIVDKIGLEKRLRYSEILANILSITCFLTFFVLVASFYNFIFNANVSRTYFHYDFLLLGGLSAGLVFFTLLAPKGPIHRLMVSKFMVFWGKVSFSAYLWHLLVLYILQSISIASTAIWVLFMAMTAIVSFVSYRFIEQPLSNIGYRPTLKSHLKR